MPVWKKTEAVRPSGAANAVPGYRDLRLIGRGGFSVVYRAQHDQLQRLVALKVLTVELVDPPARRRFLREVQLTSRLAAHPNVVTVLDSGLTDSGRPYLAMDYFERGSLRDRLVAGGPLPVADVLRTGVKIAGALASAHQSQILHRDVKPQNILVSRYGEPALADFGTARLVDALDISARTEALTPYHAAPEILQGDSPTPACDIYSLGSTLYQLLTGRPPYHSDAGGIAALLLRILNEDPPRITRRDVPSGAVEAIQRAMAKNPADRYPDALAFAHALQGVEVALSRTPTELPGERTTPQAITLPRPAPEPPSSAPVPEASAPVPEPEAGPAHVAAAAAAPSLSTPAAGSAPAAPLDSRAEGRIRRRSARRAGLVLGVVVLAAVALAVPLVLTTALVHRPQTAPSSAAPAASPLAGGPVRQPVPPPDPSAVRPSGVTAADGGTTVSLHWSLPPAAGRYAVVVQVDPGDQVKLLSPGTTADLVMGLNPSSGYCFLVGTLLVLGTGSTPPTVAWATPATCIRGAVAVTPSR